MAKQISTARKVGRVIKSILKLALAFVLAALMAAGNLVLPGFSRMGNSFLGGYSQSWDNSNLNTAGLDLDYNKPDYDSESIKDAEKDLDRRLAAEGVVLAQNDGDALPLAKGTKLSFFGANSRTLGSAQSMLTAATGGSSSSSAALNAALEAHGLSANTTLQEFYSEGAGKDYVQGAGSVSFGDAEDFRLNECPISVMQGAGVLDSAKDTTPVFVMKRVAGEGRDAPRSMYNHADSAEDKVKNYLEPDSTELQILQYINDNFDNGIVLVNSAVVVELDWLAQFPNIRACLLVPSTGTDGMDSLAGILSGDINPSGRTVDTFAADALGSPAAQNFGDYQYVDADGNLTKYNYVSYAEGIYVGYKYYETRYEDAVLGQGNAGDFDYDAEVVYPFGHGLSYTDFAWSDYKTSWDGKTCTAEITVTNTGDVAGKDVVELYAQSPYTDYDRANGVEKAAVQLVGYAKTKQLEPGESQLVQVTFDESELKAYDAEGAGTYILDAGTYYVTAAHDAHDAAKNVLAAKGAQVDGDASRTATYVPANTEVDTTTYAVDDYSGKKIENQLADAAGDVDYLSRADWEGTFPTHDGEPMEGVVSTWGNEINGKLDGQDASLLFTKTASDELIAKLDSLDSGNPVDDAKLTDEPVYGAKNGLTLADMRGLSYDDPKWSDLLNELTPEDYDVSIARGGYGTEHLDSVGKPFNIDADTAAGLIYGGTGYMFCGPLMLAQTYNTDLALEYGQIIGNEALLGGATNWYAPSMNIHRTPFSGRNGEYYSEDSFLSGAVASRQILGAAQKGFFATIKHFAFNDQENHRGDREGQYSIATWLNEQSAREIYLKPFEMCMKVGDVDLNYVSQKGDGSYENATTTIRACQGIMTGFNRVGATWTGGSYGLLTGIVRNEWGFDGWIITDNANTGVFMDAAQMIRAGGDSKLTYEDQASKGMWSFDKANAADYHYAREAMHHLLYLTANGKGMNDSMPGSVLRFGMPLLTKVQIGINVVGVAGLGLIGFTAWRNHVKRKAERAEA